MRSTSASTTMVKRSQTSEATVHRNSTSLAPLPHVVALNCIEDCAVEQSALAGVATVEHVALSRLSEGKIESATAVLVHSLSFLPRAAQRRLSPYQVILCLGSSDRAVDSALAAELGLRLVHIDVSRSEEIADTVMALFLGLLRRTHMLSRHSLSASGWLGSVQPLCRGMRRCRGLVLGIVGRSASARALANRILGFRISVLYFDVPDGKRRPSFPPAARKMDTLNDLLAASDLVSLHCALSNETVQIINAECLQHVKPGAFLVNTGSNQLLDDCALKQLLIDGTLAGCALDGAEGPQWMEAWVREMPNVIIIPRSADYSEEVWMEIREKAISVLQSYFFDGAFPSDAVSDEDLDEEESELINATEQLPKLNKPSDSRVEKPDDIQASPCSSSKNPSKQPMQSQASSLKQTGAGSSEGKRSRSVKKAKKRHGRLKSAQVIKNDDALSGTDQAPSSGSISRSPESSRTRKTSIDVKQDSKPLCKALDMLKDGCVIALHCRGSSSLHVARQRVKGGGWYLDALSSVSKRDPSAQFLVIFSSKDTIGFRSFVAEGKLLQINRRMEFVFASHSFDVLENWTTEGSLDECRLVNCRNLSAVLDVRVELLACVGDDGVTRWLE